MTDPVQPQLVLASASTVRRTLLQAAGVAVTPAAAAIDEPAIKAAMLAEGAPPRDIADKLAETKALKVARRFPDAFVLGGDQVLVHDGALLDKPANRDVAADQLRMLRGGTHQLLSAAVIVASDQTIWRHIGEVRLQMRDFSDAFLNRYLAAEGPAILDCVGGYRLEGRGIQLFSRIEGDYFTVLGIPLLETLNYLRQHGILDT
ncbi:MAG: Maf family nucleotide pyrophosphatase [Pseudomonadota bacterium]